MLYHSVYLELSIYCTLLSVKRFIFIVRHSLKFKEMYYIIFYDPHHISCAHCFQHQVALNVPTYSNVIITCEIDAGC